MDTKTLFAVPVAVRLEKIVSANNALVLIIKTRKCHAEYPRCSFVSTRIHNRYTHRVADLPWHGVALSLELHARRVDVSTQVIEI